MALQAMPIESHIGYRHNSLYLGSRLYIGSLGSLNLIRRLVARRFADYNCSKVYFTVGGRSRDQERYQLQDG